MNLTQYIKQKINFFEKLGPRALGTPSLMKASKNIEKEFKNMKISNKLLKSNSLFWDFKKLKLKINNTEVSGIANIYSPSCQLIADWVIVKDLQNLRKYKKKQIQGKILILSGDLSKNVLFPQKYPFFNLPEHQETYKLLSILSPSAVIFISQNPNKLESISQDEDFHISSITISTKEAEKILSYPHSKINLEIASDISEHPSFHAIATINKNSSKKIIIGSHLDTFYSSSGAHDNTSGILCLLLIAKIISSLSYVENLPYSIEFIAFVGHELSGKPELDYLNLLKEEKSDIISFINIDGVGHKQLTEKISFYNIDPKAEVKILEFITDNKVLKKGEQYFEGEHTIFAQQGISCLSIGISKSLNIHHTPLDTFELLDPQKIIIIAKKISEIIINWTSINE